MRIINRGRQGGAAHRGFNAAATAQRSQLMKTKRRAL